ncbi:MAG: type II toxin-antitoxin system HicB family antitoxin [Lachnospiraceae bacterium]|nr:type II toxin-antitoxin system HicB family antitoxin [Lachnospiraceae bacterium]
MAKYVYPAVFTKEEKGYSVIFHDLEGCYTCGDTLEEALYMAEDVLAFTLYDYEKEGKAIPEPSNSFDLKDGDFVNYIRCDTEEYHRRNNNRAVKKTLSIPEWLNEKAVAEGLNFSQVLQNALKEQLHLV